MDAEEAKSLLTKEAITGTLRLEAQRKYSRFEIWVWLDDAGCEHVTKVMGKRRFGWTPDLQVRGQNFIDSNRIPRVNR